MNAAQSVVRLGLAAVLSLMLAGCGDDSGTADTGPQAGGGATMQVPAGDGDMAGGGDGDMLVAGDGGDGDGTTTTGDGDASADAYAYSACETAERVGGFRVALVQPVDLDPYSALEGRVTDGVRPENVADVIATEGDCSLLQARLLFCDPDCGFGEVCSADGTCAPEPVGVDMGTVEVQGLVDGPIVMEPRAPRFNYTNVGSSLTHPAFEEGARITLDGSGSEGPALSLQAEGVAALVVNENPVAVAPDTATVVTWNPPAQAGRSRVIAELNISLHGGDPVRIHCDTDDDGSLEIPASLITELLSYSYSGFPAIGLVRQTAHAVTTPAGCVDFRVQSSLERHPVEIEGQVSCNDQQDDCPAGQSCNLALMLCE